jgi:hypothetical protein
MKMFQLFLRDNRLCQDADNNPADVKIPSFQFSDFSLHPFCFNKSPISNMDHFFPSSKILNHLENVWLDQACPLLGAQIACVSVK